jgi:membrane protease YdiL (CAAX protease family)
MTFDKKYTALTEASLCSMALMVFSFLIRFEFPLKLLSLSVLVLPAYFFSRQLLSFLDKREKTGKSVTFMIPFLFSLAGIICGIMIAMFYRWHLGISMLPQSFHYFVIIAALIGAIEELVFRGFIQEKLKSINGPFSVFFSTISHTGYKCCLFLAPMAATGIDIPFLAFWTFLFGLLFGTIKHLSGSIVPSLVAHVLFDILVYAEFVKAPWWVW